MGDPACPRFSRCVELLARCVRSCLLPTASGDGAARHGVWGQHGTGHSTALDSGDRDDTQDRAGAGTGETEARGNNRDLPFPSASSCC